MKKTVVVRGVNAGVAAKVLTQNKTNKDEQQKKRQLKRENQVNIGEHKRECKSLSLFSQETLESFEWIVDDAHHVIQLGCDSNGDYGSLVREAIGQDGYLDVLLYSDELTPGNPLQPDPSRKVNLFYIAPDLPQAITSEWTWWTLASIRQQKVREIEGGLSKVCEVLLTSMDDNWKGKSLCIHGEWIIVRLRLKLFIADESCLHLILANKGAAGRRPCFRCRTVVSKATEMKLAEINGMGHFHSLSTNDLSVCPQNADGDIWRALETLENISKNGTKKELETFETNVGWRWDVNSFLMCEPLRLILPPSKFRFDALHCYYSKGILGLEIGMLMQRCEEEDIGLVRIQKKMQSLHKLLSTSHNVSLQAFSERFFSESTWKANASTQMSTWPLLFYVLEEDLTEEEKQKIRKEKASFDALCEEMQIKQQIKHGRCESLVDQFREKQKISMQKFMECWGIQSIKPKHHYRMHLGQQVEEDHHLYDCAVLERKHRMCKAEVESRGAFLQGLDKSLTPRMNLLQASEMKKNFSYSFAQTKKKEYTVGCWQIKEGWPLFLPKLQVLAVVVPPNKDTPRGFCRTRIYQRLELRTQVVQTWRQTEKFLDVALCGQWCVPSFWNIKNESAITLG